MQHCTICGTEVAENARFCRHCGHTLNPSDVATETINTKKTSSMDGNPPDDLATLSTHPLPDTGAQEREPVSIATIDVPSEDASETPSISEIPTSTLQELAISEIPTSALPDANMTEAKEKDDEVSATSSSPVDQTPLTEAKPSLAVIASSPSPAIKRTFRPPVKWLIIALVCLLVVAAGAGAIAFFAHAPSAGLTGNVTPTVATTPTALPVITPIASVTTLTPITARGSKADLTFFGAVSGHMSDINIVTCGSQASVAGSTQYHVALFGTVNRQQYAFAFNIYPYTHPDIYTAAVFSFFGPAGETSSIAQWHSYPALGVSVTVNSNGKSGFLNIGYVSNSNNSTAQVVGNWTCA